MDRLIFLPFSTNGQKRRKKKKGDLQYSLPKEAEKKGGRKRKGTFNTACQKKQKRKNAEH